MLVQELKYACRSLMRAKGFAFTVIVTLALGIGVNTREPTSLHRQSCQPSPAFVVPTGPTCLTCLTRPPCQPARVPTHPTES